MSMQSTEATGSFEQLEAVEMLVKQSAERFEQLGALSISLRHLMQTPALHQDPLIASAQLSLMHDLAIQSAEAADAMLEQLGRPRDSSHSHAVLQARASFVQTLL